MSKNGAEGKLNGDADVDIRLSSGPAKKIMSKNISSGRRTST